MTDAAQVHALDGSSTAEPQQGRRPGGLRSWLVVVPLLAFGAIAVLCYFRLGADTSTIPSALIGRPTPAFDLPLIRTDAGPKGPARMTAADLKQGGVSIVNFFASYCEPCKQESPLLMQLAGDKSLAAKGVRLVGIAWEDKSTQATRGFLATDGNPFALVGEDLSGRMGIDWGLTGIPETYVVKGDGTIVFKYVGELTAAVVANILLPQVAKAANR